MADRFDEPAELIVGMSYADRQMIDMMLPEGGHYEGRGDHVRRLLKDARTSEELAGEIGDYLIRKNRAFSTYQGETEARLLAEGIVRLIGENK